MNLTSPLYIKDLMERHDFGLCKSLGQNFLISPHIPIKIADAAKIDNDSTVLEIGPGIGCLTRELSKRAKKVISVEIDSKLLPVLKETLADCNNIEVINCDILKLDLKELCKKNGEIIVCANLPYYITTPIILKLFEEKLPIVSMTVMIQKEVAKRFCAEPGTSDYGAVTLAINYYTKPNIMFSVSPACFMPKPKVESTVIRLDLVPTKYEVNNQKMLFSLIKAGFSERRKTLQNALYAIGIKKETTAGALEKLGIDISARAEILSLEDFIKLTELINQI